jgi:hypothetical protein
LPETTKPGGQKDTPLDADAPKAPKKEEPVPSRKIRWEGKRSINKPEEFVKDADLET